MFTLTEEKIMERAKNYRRIWKVQDEGTDSNFIDFIALVYKSGCHDGFYEHE